MYYYLVDVVPTDVEFWKDYANHVRIRIRIFISIYMYNDTVNLHNYLK